MLAVPFWKAFKNFLEQLSINWLYNAKMISSRMLAEIDNVLSWDFSVYIYVCERIVLTVPRWWVHVCMYVYINRYI